MQHVENILEGSHALASHLYMRYKVHLCACVPPLCYTAIVFCHERELSFCISMVIAELVSLQVRVKLSILY